MSCKFTFVCPIKNIVSTNFRSEAGIGGSTYFDIPYIQGCNPSDILTINDYIKGGKIINILKNDNDNNYLIDVLQIPENNNSDSTISSYEHIESLIITYNLEEFNNNYTRPKYDYSQYIAYESIGKEWSLENKRTFIDGNLALLRKNPRNSGSNSHAMIGRIKYINK